MQTNNLPQRAFHAAYGLELDELDVVLVESDQTIRIMLQKMVGDLGVKKLRVPRSIEDAFGAMRQMPPNVLIVDQHTHPLDGLSLVRRMRMPAAGPLCYVPAILTIRNTTGSLIESAISSGVNQVLLKPFSPRTLAAKLRQLSTDSRCHVLRGDRYVLEQCPQPAAS